MISGVILIHEQPVLLGEAGTYGYRHRPVADGTVRGQDLLQVFCRYRSLGNFTAAVYFKGTGENCSQSSTRPLFSALKPLTMYTRAHLD